jgi:hypothetical protein
MSSRVAPAIVAAIAVLSAAAQSDGRPDPFAVYYGRPGAVNGATSTSSAAQTFDDYARVVLAPGVESLFHPDHAAATAVIAALPQTQFFGAVSLDMTNGGWTTTQIAASMYMLQAMGARGVLLDRYGYEWGVTRTRQNLAVDLAHAANLSVLANASVPDDAFSPVAMPLNPTGGGNPTGAPTHLGASDRYLLDGFVVAGGAIQTAASFTAKAQSAAAWRAVFGTRIDAATTTAFGVPFSQGACDYAWWVATAFALDGFAWREATDGAGTDLLPFRSRPAARPFGTPYAPCVVDVGHDRVWRPTGGGTVRVDLAASAGCFVPALLIGPEIAPIGTTTAWTISAPTSPFAVYFTGASTALAPGISLLDGRTLPLAIDALFLLAFSASPFFGNFFANLDAAGESTVTLTPPPAPELSGFAIYLAYAVIDPAEWTGVATYSSALPVVLW